MPSTRTEFWFEPIKGSTSGKVRCIICGATGFPGCRWQEKCRIGHPFQCPICGARKTTKVGLANHIRMAKRH